jgi:hypothetical protein
MTNAQRSLNYLESCLDLAKDFDPDIGGHIQTIANELQELRDACKAAYDWLEGAPITELEAVEDALGENAPLALLEEALKGGRDDLSKVHRTAV